MPLPPLEGVIALTYDGSDAFAQAQQDAENLSRQLQRIQQQDAVVAQRQARAATEVVSGGATGPLGGRPGSWTPAIDSAQIGEEIGREAGIALATEMSKVQAIDSAPLQTQTIEHVISAPGGGAAGGIGALGGAIDSAPLLSMAEAARSLAIEEEKIAIATQKWREENAALFDQFSGATVRQLSEGVKASEESLRLAADAAERYKEQLRALRALGANLGDLDIGSQMVSQEELDNLSKTIEGARLMSSGEAFSAPGGLSGMAQELAGVTAERLRGEEQVVSKAEATKRVMEDIIAAKKSEAGHARDAAAAGEGVTEGLGQQVDFTRMIVSNMGLMVPRSMGLRYEIAQLGRAWMNAARWSVAPILAISAVAAATYAAIEGSIRMIEELAAKERDIDQLSERFGGDPGQLADRYIGSSATSGQLREAAGGVDVRGALTDLETFGEVAQSVQQHTATLGDAFVEQMSKVVDAIETGNTKFLEQEGFVSDAEGSIIDYAQAQGLAISSLSAFQRQQALANAVIQDSTNYYERIPRAVREWRESSVELTQSISDVTDAAKNLVGTGMIAWIERINELFGVGGGEGGAISQFAELLNTLAGQSQTRQQLIDPAQADLLFHAQATLNDMMSVESFERSGIGQAMMNFADGLSNALNKLPGVEDVDIKLFPDDAVEQGEALAEVLEKVNAEVAEFGSISPENIRALVELLGASATGPDLERTGILDIDAMMSETEILIARNEQIANQITEIERQYSGVISDIRAGEPGAEGELDALQAKAESLQIEKERNDQLIEQQGLVAQLVEIDKERLALQKQQALIADQYLGLTGEPLGDEGAGPQMAEASIQAIAGLTSEIEALQQAGNALYESSAGDPIKLAEVKPELEEIVGLIDTLRGQIEAIQTAGARGAELQAIEAQLNGQRELVQAKLDEATSNEVLAQSQERVLTEMDLLLDAYNRLQGVSAIAREAVTGIPLMQLSTDAGEATRQLNALATAMDTMGTQAQRAGYNIAAGLIPKLGFAAGMQYGDEFAMQAEQMTNAFNQINIARDQAGLDMIHESVLGTGLTALKQNQGMVVSELTATGNSIDQVGKQINSALDSMISGIMQTTTGGLIPKEVTDELDGWVDKVDENARRMADVAVKGFESPWFEKLVEWGLIPEDVQQQSEDEIRKWAAHMVQAHEEGLTFMFYNTEDIVDRVMAKLRASQEKAGFIEGIREQIKELGGEADDLDIMDALGIDTTGQRVAKATSKAFDDFLADFLAMMTGEGVDVSTAIEPTPDDLDQITVHGQTAADAMGEAIVVQFKDGNYGERAVGELLKSIQKTENQTKLKNSGKEVAGWLGGALLEEFGESVPPGLLRILVEELVPLLEAARAENAGRTSGGGVS